MFMVALAKFFGIAIVLVAIALAVSWIIRSAVYAKIKVDNTTVKNRIENDLMRRLDEVRPANFARPFTKPTDKH